MSRGPGMPERRDGAGVQRPHLGRREDGRARLSREARERVSLRGAVPSTSPTSMTWAKA